MNWKYIISILVVVLILFSVWFYSKNPLSAKVTIHNTEFLVDLAITPKEKSTGLSFRKSLLPKHGMLFVYEHKDTYPFWMKDMKFPLDFIWIDGNQIVDITKDVPPETSENMRVVKPKLPVNKILEINAGEADTYTIQIGDTVTFNE